jgi:hypothetical protein
MSDVALLRHRRRQLPVRPECQHEARLTLRIECNASARFVDAPENRRITAPAGFPRDVPRESWNQLRSAIESVRDWHHFGTRLFREVGIAGKVLELFGDPSGSRTRVPDVRGRCPNH